MLIELSKAVYVDPLDVSSVETNDRYDWEGGEFSGHSVRAGDGTRIILKNGLKVYVPIHINEVIKKLEGQ